MQTTTASPVATTALAPGEVLLEVSASAIESAPVASATFRVWVQTSGATPAAAEADRDRVIAQVLQAARAVGASREDIIVEPSETRVPTSIVPEGTRGSTPAPQASVSASVRVTLRNPANFESFSAAVTAAGATTSGRPDMVAGDDSAARRTARTRALASARADAEAYAAALNMRVGRMVRVTERTGPDCSE